MSPEALFGFDGRLDPDASLQWATAAIQRGTLVYNEATGISCSIAEAKQLARSGHLHQLKAPIPLRHSVPKGGGSVVLVLRVDSSAYEIVQVDGGKASGPLAASARRGDHDYIVFRTRAQFENVRKDRIKAVLRHALQQPAGSNSIRDVVQAGLFLQPRQPVLNALSVFLQEAHIDSPAERVARRVSSDENLYASALSALIESREYHIEYKKGVASHEGLELNDAADIVKAFDTVSKKLKSGLEHLFPWIPRWPSPTFHALQPGSAKISLTTEARSNEIGERLARYLHLQQLERTLASGVPPDGVPLDTSLEAAIATIVQPSEDTVVRHKPLPLPSDAAVQPMPEHIIEEHIEDQIEVRVVGFVVGISSGRRVELSTASKDGKCSGRIWMSLQNNGDKESPSGVEIFENRSDFLYRPVVATIMLQHRRTTTRFFLRSVTPVNSKLLMLTHVPSSVVPGAFVAPPEPVGFDTRGLVLGDEVVDATPLQGIKEARSALQRFHARIRHRELGGWFEAEQPTGWVVPRSRVALREYERIVVSLWKNGGKLEFNELIDDLNSRFAVFVRVNNTNRAIKSASSYLVDHRGKLRHIELTERGRRLGELLAQHHPAGGG